MQLISYGDERERNSLQNDILPNIVTLLFNLLFHLTFDGNPLRSNCLEN